MEKRAILAIVLSLLVVFLWSIFFAPAPPPPPPPEEATAPPPAAPPAPPPPVVAEPPAVPPGPETTVTVDTGVTRLELSSRGAAVKAVQLLAYRAFLAKEAPPVEIAPLPGTAALPLRAELQWGRQRLALSPLAFTPSQRALVLSPQQPEGRLVFRARLPDGTPVQRTYRFFYQRYDFEVETRLAGPLPQGAASLTLFWGPGLRQQPEHVERRGETKAVSRSFVNGKLVHEDPEEAGEVREDRGTVTWVALADTYFTAVLLPQEPLGEAAIARRLSEEALEVAVRTPLAESNPAQRVRVYVGPKMQPLLTQLDPSLSRLIDLGFFSPLARPMVQVLRLVNRVVHNYGVSIILVTILIRLVFWPLTQKSYKSMQAMQKLQPKLKELQVLYKDDRQALNRAMMQLYREHKVNPMGGCLPMLLQIPFFFAFYNALLYAIELRHAPFICWDKELFWVGRGICDLSVHDPSYITPVLMGLSMFLQQRLTPTTADPTQAKIMQFMPLLFLIFFLKAPAGLVLYWLMSNVLSIVQQLLINRAYRQETVAAEAVSKEK